MEQIGFKCTTSRVDISLGNYNFLIFYSPFNYSLDFISPYKYFLSLTKQGWFLRRLVCVAAFAVKRVFRHLARGVWCSDEMTPFLPSFVFKFCDDKDPLFLW